MLSIQPPDALRLTVQLSSGDAGVKEIPLINSDSRRYEPFHHKLKTCLRLDRVKEKIHEGNLILKKEIKKEKRSGGKLAQVSSISLPSTNSRAHASPV